jgi:predicted small secreted protein
LAVSRFAITVGIGIVVTVFVYFGLQDSLKHPSIIRTSIPPETAENIVRNAFNISQEDSVNLKSNYVYLKPNGDVYQLDSVSNRIGGFLDKSEPTITGGSHYALQIKDTRDNKSYYVDYVTGEIVSSSNSHTK